MGVKLQRFPARIGAEAPGQHFGVITRTHQRAVMFHDAFQRLPGEVQAFKLGVAGFKLGHHAQGLGVMIKAAEIRHGFRQGVLARMAKRRMPQIVGQGAGFGQILIHVQRPRQGPGDLGHFQRMGQARAIGVAFMSDENLRLFLEPAKGAGMDDPVAITLERASHGAFRLGVMAAAAFRRIAGIRSAHLGHLLLHCRLRSFFRRQERPYTDARP